MSKRDRGLFRPKWRGGGQKAGEYGRKGGIHDRDDFQGQGDRKKWRKTNDN